jgi:hypothetical protein
MVAVQKKERPILFAGEMVRAIHADVKTQTRRTIDRIPKIGRISEFGRSDTPGYDYRFRCKQGRWHEFRAADLLAKCPHGQRGEHLWVRESFLQPRVSCQLPCGEYQGYWTGGRNDIKYAADGIKPHWKDPSTQKQWYANRPSIHMPRWASRILLEITDIRIEQLREISHEDAIAEGVKRYADEDCYKIYMPTTSFGTSSPIKSFASLWDSINGIGAWESNPWTWAVSFKRIAKH